MHEVDIYLFFLPLLNICSDGLLFRLKWESRCQRSHLLKNDETDWRMRPGWYSNLKARELINLSAGVANVGIKAQTQIVMEQMKVEVVSAENVPRGRNQVQRSHRHRLYDGASLLQWSEDKTNMFQIPVTSVPGKQVSPGLLPGGEETASIHLALTPH